VGCIRVKVPVDWCVGRKILNEHTAYICPTWTTFKMEALGSSEMLVSWLTCTPSYTRMLGNIHHHLSENIKFRIVYEWLWHYFLSSSLDIFSTQLCSQEQDNIRSEALYYFLITKEWSLENSFLLSKTTIWNLQMIGDYIILRWFIPFMLISDIGNYGQPLI
jgi:hypothetical protein